MKKFLNKAPQIVLKTMTGEKLSQGQKEAMHGIRAVINGEPTPEQRQELDAEKQRAADAEMQLQQQQAASDAAAAETIAQQQRAAETEKQTQLLRQQLEEAKAAKAAMEADQALAENAKLQAELGALKQPAAASARAPLPNHDEIDQQALDASALEEGIRASNVDAASALEAKELEEVLNLSKQVEEQRKAGIKREMEVLAPKVMSNSVPIENIHLTPEKYGFFEEIVKKNWDADCVQSTGYEYGEAFLYVIQSQMIGVPAPINYDFTS